MSQSQILGWKAAAGASATAFLKVATVDARLAESNAHILGQFRQDDIQALVIENLFSPAECEAIVLALENNSYNFPKTWFPEPFRSFFFGANLNLAHPDLAEYFAMAPAFDRALDALMRPYGGFEAKVLGLLSRMDGGRPYQAAPGPDGKRSYMATTLRAHLQGGYIPAHFDNEQTGRQTFRHLLPLIEGDLFSFVVTLQSAQNGGALEVYDATADRYGRQFVNHDTRKPKPDLSETARMNFDVQSGTMVVLRSGRYLHRLTPVAGTRTRWTFCSFMAKSRASDAIFCWG